MTDMNIVACIHGSWQHSFPCRILIHFVSALGELILKERSSNKKKGDISSFTLQSDREDRSQSDTEEAVSEDEDDVDPEQEDTSNEEEG